MTADMYKGSEIVKDTQTERHTCLTIFYIVNLVKTQVQRYKSALSKAISHHCATSGAVEVSKCT